MNVEDKKILESVKDDWCKKWNWRNWADYSWKMGVNEKMINEIAEEYARRVNNPNK